MGAAIFKSSTAKVTKEMSRRVQGQWRHINVINLENEFQEMFKSKMKFKLQLSKNQLY